MNICIEVNGNLRSQEYCLVTGNQMLRELPWGYKWSVNGWNRLENQIDYISEIHTMTGMVNTLPIGLNHVIWCNMVNIFAYSYINIITYLNAARSLSLEIYTIVEFNLVIPYLFSGMD